MLPGIKEFGKEFVNNLTEMVMITKTHRRPDMALQEEPIVQAIPVDKAYFCMDCRNIVLPARDKTGTICPLCSSSMIHPVLKWLDHDPEASK